MMNAPVCPVAGVSWLGFQFLFLVLKLSFIDLTKKDERQLIKTKDQN